MPPAPKPVALRQRRNRTPGAATLPSAKSMAKNTVPDLPKREKATEIWHPLVVAWWRSVWTSPMASEYLPSDVNGGLFQLAELHQVFWAAATSKERLAAAAEIRLQEVRFGLSPIDRRRLQWEVEKGEKAVEQTTSRRKARRLQRLSKKNPRDVLQVVP